MDVDASQNYLIWNNCESVQFVSHGRLVDITYGLSLAKRRPLTFKEQAASGGVYVGWRRVWLLPSTILAAGGVDSAHVPKPADRIIDADGVQWTVLEAEYHALKATWKLTTIALVLANALRDIVSIWKPTNTADPAGSRVPNFAPVYTNVAARIQEAEGETRDERGQRLTARQYMVYVGQRVVVGNEYQLRDADGNIYEIKGDQNPDRIDELQVLQCERRNW